MAAPTPTHIPFCSTAVAARRWLPVALVTGAFALGLLRLVGLVADNAVDILVEDQWDMLRPLFQQEGPLACFLQQHGPHRLGLGGLVNWYLYNATGGDVRAESWATLVTLTLAAGVAVGLAVRLRGRLSWSDAAFPLLILSPVQWETMLLTPFLGHSILPLLLTLLLALAWTIKAPGWRVFSVGVLSGVALFTGFGLCGAVASAGLAGLFWLRPEAPAGTTRRQATWLLALALLALGLFALHYRWEPAVPGWRFPVPQWWDYARFPALMFTSLLGWRALTPASTALGGGVLVLCLVAWADATRALYLRRATARDRAVWLLIGASMVYAALTAVGRLPIRLEAAFMWRYTTLMLPAVCGLLLAAEAWTENRPAWMRHGRALLGLALAGVIWGDLQPERNAAAIAYGKMRWVAAYLHTRDLAAANRAARYEVYSPAPASPIIAEQLRWLERHRWSFLRALPVEAPEPPPAAPQPQ